MILTVFRQSICYNCGERHPVEIDMTDSELWIKQANWEAAEFSFCSAKCEAQYRREYEAQ